jgi:hypothetical protein
MTDERHANLNDWDCRTVGPFADRVAPSDSLHSSEPDSGLTDSGLTDSETAEALPTRLGWRLKEWNHPPDR